MIINRIVFSNYKIKTGFKRIIFPTNLDFDAFC